MATKEELPKIRRMHLTSLADTPLPLPCCIVSGISFQETLLQEGQTTTPPQNQHNQADLNQQLLLQGQQIEDQA